ncbi:MULTISPECIES: hypothetical protein [unclassified Variovorax]|uniref:hypothetical protein n=1 Tax=unclassified Variovorax TaxID=663243 RepID=UPI00076D37B0|nr:MULTISPECIES: hypothetical protein [unclassified Variovorax]KWT91929.1 hypothetical protein APY03_3132 [Variovorax sp. WDL1]PNG46881.1 hypothetical protein CHC06_07224 [Variovorax sp. B2]PNG48468.1 hypothetical protein CHC07_07644 [Variovorax sp. B4]VTV14706.1 hypothetical protein WDL1CHR_05198 [Variovorax sp. WDL1]
MTIKSRSLRHLVAAVVMSTSALAATQAFAHGAAKPKHGGVVQSASDLSFELVPTGDGATLYVIDHDAEFDTAGTSGKLTALNGADRSEAELKPAGGNKLEAKGVKLAKGSKVVAVLTTPAKKAVTVRFTMK